MNFEVVTMNDTAIAVLRADTVLIRDANAALDLFMTAHYQTGSNRLLLDKRVFCEEFFILSSGLAGEILQKCSNYHFKLAIVGDYSTYTSKPLHDFIYESNQGHTVFFPATEQEGLEALSRA